MRCAHVARQCRLVSISVRRKNGSLFTFPRTGQLVRVRVPASSVAALWSAVQLVVEKKSMAISEMCKSAIPILLVSWQ